MKYSLSILVVIALTSSIVTSAATINFPVSRCKGPTTKVIVTVTKNVVPDGNSYVYSVTNNAAKPIANLKLGDSDKMELKPFPGQDIVVTGSPMQWDGNFGQKYESIYGDVFWYANNKAFIQLGNTLSGFAIIATGNFTDADSSTGNDGQPIKPVDFENLPFEVDFYKGGCAWGRVTPAP